MVQNLIQEYRWGHAPGGAPLYSLSVAWVSNGDSHQKGLSIAGVALFCVLPS